jgi:hypothetical protein
VTFGPISATSTVRVLPFPWQVPNACLYFLALALLVLVFLLFPTGQFVPRWTRWTLVGFVLLLVPALSSTSALYPLLALEVVGDFLLLVIALSFGFANLRYRLWDIDLIIRRTLIYSTLTALLAVIYEVSVFTLQSLTSGLTFMKGNQLAIVVSTFLIGGLFKPLYNRTRALIDRRFYRRKYDAARTIAAFSTTIRDEVDLNQLCT